MIWQSGKKKRFKKGWYPVIDLILYYQKISRWDERQMGDDNDHFSCGCQ